MRKYKTVKTVWGEEVLPNEEIERLRVVNDPHCFIAQKGGQENALRSMADITIMGGNRGGGKSIYLLMEGLKDVMEPGFSALILRNERDDLTNIIKQSYLTYRNFGTYFTSKDMMYWQYAQGGELYFSFHAGDYKKFEIRFQGREYNYIAIDEITHITYKKFQYIKSCLRNGFGLRPRIVGTCNPDPDSWVAPFIGWWIDDEGNPMPERDGVLRYCFMMGDDVTDIIWGDTKEECYERACHKIDPLMKEGDDWRDYILSVTFIRAELDDNKKLPKSYKANLASQSEEQVARDLLGNWKYKSKGDDILKWQSMEDFYDNGEQTGDGVRRCSCDVAFDGGDNLVMWLRIGNHFQDVFVSRADSRNTVGIVKAKLAEWGVREENFTYDLNGAGQVFKGFFPRAKPFNNLAAVEDRYKYVYDKLKDQAAYVFAQKVLNREVSINPVILERRYDGRGFRNMSLRDILLRERRAIRQDASFEKAWKLVVKNVMKQMIGHSPDFIEAMFYSELFFIQGKTYSRPKGLGRFISPTRYR